MKLEDLKFKDGVWITVNILPDQGDPVYKNFFEKILKESKDTAEFTEKFLANADYKNSYGYKALLKSEKPEEEEKL